MRLQLRHIAVAVFAAAATASDARSQAPSGTLIRNASIIDGRGTPARRGDVRIQGDRIVAIGQLTPTATERVVDAHGLALAPGFIDTHSHHDRGLFNARNALAMVSQGVTTIVVGQDGSGNALAALFARLDSQPVAVNVASYVGHGSVRRAVLGNDYQAPRDRGRDRKDEGARPRRDGRRRARPFHRTRIRSRASTPPPDEVRALAKVAGDAGGRYISHMRSEDRDFWSALDELITIGRVNRMPVQVSHIKLGMRDLWGQGDSLIHVLDRARASGVQVTADIYPWVYWQSNLGVFYPKRNFADSAETEFILAHLTGPEDIIFNSVPGHADYRGKTLAQIAQLRGRSPGRTMMDLLAEPGGSGAGVVAKGMDDADVEKLVRWPYANICSDGQSTGLHPRGFGSFAKVLGPYVRDKKLFTLEEAVRKMSSLAAANVGLVRRGTIETGAFADLVLFDPATVTEHATFDTPQGLATGVQTVWVNGEIVVRCRRDDR